MLDQFKITLEYKREGKIINSTKYKCDDYTFAHSYKNGRFELVFVPKHKLKLCKLLLTYNYTYKEDTKVFCNGYQSWSYSREYANGEKFEGLKSIAKYPPVKNFAYTSGEYHFVDYPKKVGNYHSITYGYVRRGNEYTIIGSLSERAGYTIIRYDYNNNLLKIEKDVEGKVIEAGEQVKLVDVYYEVGGYDQIFDNYFKQMEIKPPNLKRLSGYTSWYNYFGKITEEIILRDLDSLQAIAEDNAQIFQIDDGYQTAVGDWLSVDKAKFPRGMKYVADCIHAKGYLAGIWLAPFNCQKNSKIVKEHPGWLIRNKKGKPYISAVAWGGSYTLDFYLPEVREYLKKVFSEVLDIWGYDMVKLDFLYSVCMYPLYGKTRGEIMTEAMEFVRECVGDKYILGCGVPLGPAFGNVDFCRIGSDVHTSFKDPFYVKMLNREIISTRTAITNAVFRRHLNGRAFLNDPDVFLLRNDKKEFPNTKSAPLNYTWEQKELLAIVNSIFGDILFVSDNVGSYQDRQKDLLLQAYNGMGYKVLSADYEKDIFNILLEKNDEKQVFSFDVTTGNYSFKRV